MVDGAQRGVVRKLRFRSLIQVVKIVARWRFEENFHIFVTRKRVRQGQPVRVKGLNFSSRERPQRSISCKGVDIRIQGIKVVNIDIIRVN